MQTEPKNKGVLHLIPTEIGRRHIFTLPATHPLSTPAPVHRVPPNLLPYFRCHDYMLDTIPYLS